VVHETLGLRPRPTKSWSHGFQRSHGPPSRDRLGNGIDAGLTVRHPVPATSGQPDIKACRSSGLGLPVRSRGSGQPVSGHQVGPGSGASDQSGIGATGHPASGPSRTGRAGQSGIEASVPYRGDRAIQNRSDRTAGIGGVPIGSWAGVRHRERARRSGMGATGQSGIAATGQRVSEASGQPVFGRAYQPGIGASDQSGIGVAEHPISGASG
jgi:hypothetical protein